jgi:SAM-dependent methyltransferase
MAFDPQRYWEDRLAADFSLHGVGYRGLGLRYNEWLYRVRGVVFGRVRRSLPADLSTARILDVGSGTGFYVDRWRHAGAGQVTASDLTAVACEQLRRRFPGVDVRQVDIGESVEAFPAGSFDVISAFDVLFHIVDEERYQRAIRSIATWLRPGGSLLCSDNFLHGPVRRGPHQVSRLGADIEQSLLANGLEIVDRRPMFVVMNAPVDSVSPWRWRIWSWIERAVRTGERVGAIVGALLFPLELLLTAASGEGPSTEVVVCRKTERQPASVAA